MGEISCRSGTWSRGISKDFKINPLQMSSVCSMANGLLFTLTRWQLSERICIEHVGVPRTAAGVVGAHDLCGHQSRSWLTSGSACSKPNPAHRLPLYDPWKKCQRSNNVPWHVKIHEMPILVSTPFNDGSPVAALRYSGEYLWQKPRSSRSLNLTPSGSLEKKHASPCTGEVCCRLRVAR